MAAAVVDAIFAAPLEVSANCPTGNCTFEDVTTLGICGNCENISSKIKPVCSEQSLSHCSGKTSICEYTMPTGKTLSAKLYQTLRNGLKTGPGPNAAQCVRSRRQAIWNSSSLVSYDSSDVTHFEALQIPVLHHRNPLSAFQAWDCSINFCARSYSTVNVTNGSLAFSQPVERTIIPPSTFYYGFKSQVFAENASSKHNESYTIDSRSWFSLRELLDGVFVKAWTAGDLVVRPNGTVHCTAPSSTFGEVGKQVAIQDLPATFKNLTISMSAALLLSKRDTVLHSGQALLWKNYIHVSWGWLALPTVLVLITSIVLLATILQTRRNKLPAWKSSSLPSLFSQLEGRDRGSLSEGILDRDAVERVAKDTEVQLNEYTGRIYVKD